jgi:hypothetical protein
MSCYQNITEHAFHFTAGSNNLLKYRALYEFVARNSDELSFQPGDVIMVSFIYSPCFLKRVTCGAGLLFSCCLSCPAVKTFDLQDTVASFLAFHAADIFGYGHVSFHVFFGGGGVEEG